jgi:hypothetical protein
VLALPETVAVTVSTPPVFIVAVFGETETEIGVVFAGAELEQALEIRIAENIMISVRAECVRRR